MSFFRLFQHLLPRGRAWNLTASKRLRQFFQGLSGLGSDLKDFLDLVWLDSQPADTRELDAWEAQFGLGGGTVLTVAQRRARLDAAWKALGGQSPRYIQDTLQAAGFDVYVHEWWAPGTEPGLGVQSCTAARNPASYVVSVPETTSQGYALVNKLFSTRTVILPRAGVAAATAGSSIATAGRFSTFVDEPKEYPIPLDPDCWHYFLYIGGRNFPELATVPPERREEFEELCLKIRPAHLWLGILVGYGYSGQLDLSTATYRTSATSGNARSGQELDLSTATYQTSATGGNVRSGQELDLSTATFRTSATTGGSVTDGDELDLSDATYNSGI